MVAKWAFDTNWPTLFVVPKGTRYSSCSSQYVIGQWLGWGQEPWSLLLHLQQQDENLNEGLRLASSFTFIYLSQPICTMRKMSLGRTVLLVSSQWEARGPEAKASWWLQEPIGLWPHSQSGESPAQERNPHSQWLSSRIEWCQRRRWSMKESAWKEENGETTELFYSPSFPKLIFLKN